MIYLDNAATTLKKPDTVIPAVIDAMTSYGNASRGVHASALTAGRSIYRTRAKLAELFGCPDASRVIFTCNATEALNTAIMGTIDPGRHVITTVMEHNSVLRPLYRLKAEQNISLSFVQTNELGTIDPGDFEKLIRPGETQAIVCTHASNLTGNVNDIRTIGEIAHRHGLIFLVDASQSAGSIPIHMENAHIDLLATAGHKGLMGPQGTGVLCIGPGIEVRPLKVGGSGVHSYDRFQPQEYPTRLEAGTLNSHGIAGLSAALDFIREIGVEAIDRRENQLMMRFYHGVKDLPGIRIYGDFDRDRTAIVALNLSGLDSGTLADELNITYGIAVRAGAHCAPLMHRALGTEKTGAVRFSFSYFTTEEEVDAAIRAMTEIAAG